MYQTMKEDRYNAHKIWQEKKQKIECVLHGYYRSFNMCGFFVDG